MKPTTRIALYPAFISIAGCIIIVFSIYYPQDAVGQFFAAVLALTYSGTNFLLLYSMGADKELKRLEKLLAELDADI